MFFSEHSVDVDADGYRTRPLMYHITSQWATRLLQAPLLPACPVSVYSINENV